MALPILNKPSILAMVSVFVITSSGIWFSSGSGVCFADSTKQTSSSAKSPPDRKAEYNRLINESSPYLLQHATNPVNWYPRDEEAFEAGLVEALKLIK